MEREKHISCPALNISRPSPCCRFPYPSGRRAPGPTLPAQPPRNPSVMPLPVRGSLPPRGHGPRRVPVPRGTTSRTTLLRGVSFLRTAACKPGSAGSGTCPAPWLSLPTHTFTFSALPPQPPPFPNPLPALPAGLAYPRRGSGASTDLSLQ